MHDLFKVADALSTVVVLHDRILLVPNMRLPVRLRLQFAATHLRVLFGRRRDQLPKLRMVHRRLSIIISAA